MSSFVVRPFGADDGHLSLALIRTAEIAIASIFGK